MSKGLLPWSLKGVSLQARARAKAAAGEAGEPLGKWLGDTIRQIAEAEAAKTATQSVAGAASTEPPPADPETVAKPQMVVPDPLPATVTSATTEAHAVGSDEGETGTDSLSIPSAPQSTSDGPPPTASASAIEGPAAADEPLAEPSVSHVPEDWRTAFADLARRLEESERRLTTIVAPLQVAVERILSRLDNDQPRPRRGWRFPGFGRFRSDR